MNILITGSKEYPFNSGQNYEKCPCGGIEIYAENLSSFLVYRGNNVFIITRAFPGQKIIERNGKIKIYRTKFVNNKFLRNFSYNFLGFLISLKIIKKDRIDIVHCNGPVAGFFGFFIKLIIGAKIIYTPHGLVTGWKFPINFILNAFNFLSIKTADYVIFVSPIAYNKSQKQKKGKSVLIENCINPENTETKEIYQNTFFGFLGRLEEIKGIELILEAYLEFNRKYPDYKIKIAGSGSLKDYVLDFIKRENIEDSVYYVGWSKEPLNFFKSIECFVFPSKEMGHPITLLESMFSGNIVITSLPYVKDGFDGLICKAEKEDIVKKMEYVVNNKDKIGYLKENARNTIRKNYLWNKKIDEIIKIYRNVV